MSKHSLAPHSEESNAGLPTIRRNAIAVYVLAGITARLLYLIKFTGADGDTITAKAWIYDNLFASWLGDLNGSLAYAIAFIIIMYLCMLPLYKKKIFVKI